MRLLIDINVALDVILRREPWMAEAALLFSAIQQGRADGYLAGHTIPTVYYIVRENQRDKATANATVSTLLGIFDVVAAEKADFQQALGLDFPDFEDAVQAACAIKASANYVVTRKRDFKKSPVPPAPPGAVLAAIQANEI